MQPKHFCLVIAAVSILACGCASSKPKSFEIPTEKGSRDSTPLCLVPESPSITTLSGDDYFVDLSNASEGYITVDYTGSCEKVKLQLTVPDGTMYTYSMHEEADVFPLTSDSGTYTIGIFENIENTRYSKLMMESFEVTITNEFGAYLYPNQYVKFDQHNNAVALGEKLAYSANNDLDVVSNIYNYLICNISYDHNKAETAENGYLPDIDGTLESKMGICLDYAGLMAAMLRSQRIPTHMEVGYAGQSYHAWISTYITDVGWVNGIIQFNGTDWELMDPTFGASSGSKKLKKYIGDGENYRTKFIY